MPRLPVLPTGGSINLGVGGADLGGMESGNIEAAREMGNLGKQVQGLALEYAVRQKKQDDSDFAYKAQRDIYNRTQENFERLKVERPDGRGIHQAQIEFVNAEFDKLEVAAPSETARTSFVSNSRPHIDASLFSAKQYENEQVSISTTSSLIQGINLDGVALSQSGNVDAFIEARNRNLQAVEDRLNAGAIDLKMAEKLRAEGRQLAYHTGAGFLKRIDDAKSVGLKRAVYNSLERNLSTKMPMGQAVTPEESKALLSAGFSKVRAAQHESTFEIRDDVANYSAAIRVAPDPAALDGEFKRIVGKVNDTDLEPRKKFDLISQITVDKAKANALSGVVLNESSPELDMIDTSFGNQLKIAQAEAIRLSGLDPQKDSTLGMVDMVRAKAELKTQISAMIEQRDKHFPDFYAANDSNINLLENEITEQDEVTKFEVIDLKSLNAYVGAVRQKKDALDVLDKKLLSTSVSNKLSKMVMTGNAQAKTQALMSIRAATGDDFNAVMSQMMTDNAVPGQIALASFMITSTAADTVVRNATNKNLDAETESDLLRSGKKDSDVKTMIAEDAKFKYLSDAFRGSRPEGTANKLTLGLEIALRDETRMQLRNTDNLQTAYDSAWKALSLDKFEPVESDGGPLVVPGLLPQERKMIEYNLSSIQTPAGLRKLGIPVGAEFLAEREKLKIMAQTDLDRHIKAGSSPMSVVGTGLFNIAQDTVPLLKKFVLNNEDVAEVYYEDVVENMRFSQDETASGFNVLYKSIDGSYNRLRDKGGKEVYIPFSKLKHKEFMTTAEILGGAGTGFKLPRTMGLR